MILKLTIVFALAFSWAGTALALQSGTSADVGGVRGRVIDGESGKPIVKARVAALAENIPGSRKLNTLFTDEEGKFFFENLPLGSYLISAGKEEDGYPNIFYSVFALDSDASPKVLVRKDEIDDITVRLYRGGKLIGEILDSNSMQPLLTARIRFTRVDDPQRWFTTGPDVSGHFQFALPNRPFRMEVTAPGYRAWTFSENGAQVLKVEPGSEKKLKITLQKDSETSH